jgi:hypothetical protein
MKEVTDPGKKGHKKKTKDNDIHEEPTPAGLGEKRSSSGTSGEYAHFPVESSSTENSSASAPLQKVHVWKHLQNQ